MRNMLRAAMVVAAVWSPVLQARTSANVVARAAALESGQAQPDSPALTPDSRFVTGQLENGLRYVVIKNSAPPDRGLVWLHVNTGSLNETARQRGVARAIQHLTFAGTKNFPALTMGPFLQAMGNQPSPDMLSHSTFEETVFKLSIKQATPELLDRALSFLADVPADLNLLDADIERERGLLLEQKKTELKVEQRVQDYIWQHLAPGSIFGERLPTLSEDAINGLNKQDIGEYYSTWYVPSNMTVMVAADMDPAVVVERIKAKFAGAKKVERPRSQDTGVKAYDKSFSIVVADPELKQDQLYFFRIEPPHPPTKTEAELRVKLIEALAIASFNRTLGEKVSSGKVSFTTGSAFGIDLANAATLVGFNASCEPKDWKKVIAAMGTELQRTRLHGLAEADIENAKKQFALSAEQGVKAEPTRVTGSIMGGIAAAVNNGDVILSAQQTADLLAKLMPTITKKELDERFKAMFDPAAIAVVMATPTGDFVPKEDELLKAGLDALNVTPEADAQAARPTALMTTLPTPGKVVTDVEHAATKVQTWTLDNGATVHYLNNTTKKDFVNITIGVAGGIMQETAENRGITEVASLAWNRPATSKLSSTTIRELLAGKELEVGGGPGVDNLMFGVNGKAATIESGLQVAYLAMTDPFIEPPALDQWRKSNLTEAENRDKDPKAIFNEAVFGVMFPPNEVRLRPLSKAELDKLTIESASKWLKNLIETGPIEVSIVGDVSKEEAVRLATTYVGSLPKRASISDTTLDNLRGIKRPTGPVNLEKEVPTLSQASYLMIAFFAPDDVNAKDRRALFMARTMLEPRLTRVLKDQEQLVYGLQIRYDSGQEFPGFGLFRVVAPVVPEKVDAAVRIINETFTSFGEVGPTTEELEGARAQALKALDEAQLDPNYWTGELSLLSFRGKSLDDIAGERAAYVAISAADIKEAFAKYNKDENRLRVTLTPGQSPGLAPMPLPVPAK
ncbi:MAG: insulinase family protein [Pyrinomonadaceae bacterium]|nr:insulinase family protein [Phycisphaerales bacterium]